MSPPLAVTEDTPPDMLAGAMDLLAVLPNGHNIKMSVERSTPMMDLLIQITTANKISPGGHAIRAYGDRGILPYQPSTPIGTLDAWSIHIVPKKSSASTNAKKQPPFQPVNHNNTPFEQTFRLQVNLPRNQLYVSRVSYNTRLEQVFRQVCEEKNLDPSKYCLVRPDNLDEELNLNSTFLECKVQKVTLVLRSNRPQVGLSSVDIMALKRLDNGNQRCGNKYYASRSYDGSVSSGSLEGRSLSPVRSDESSVSPTTSQTNAISNKPFRKRRPAPKPPTAQNGRDSNNGCDSLTVLHSRNSSDSSGYHESSVLSESPVSNSNSLAESLPRRCKLPDNTDSNCVRQRMSSNAKCSSKIGNNLSRSLSNLATDVVDLRKCPKNFPSNGMKPKQYSASSTSLSTISGKRKKAPAPPPPPSSTKSLLSLKEEETSSICASGISSTGKENANNDAIVSSGAEDVVDAPIARNAPPPPQTCSSSSSVDSRRCSESRTLRVDVTASQSLCTDHLPVGAKDKELIMDDDEIDRIFRDATKGYESAPSSAISSPPESVENNADFRKDEIYDEELESWQYTIPSPPKGFRDQTDSPQVTEFDNVTSTNVGVTFNEEPRLKEELISPIIPQSKESEYLVDRKEQTTIESVPTSKWESKYQSSTHDSGLGSDDSIPSVHETKSNTAFREVKPTTIERRASTLQNFTISTYQSSKPTDIFCDESVKTWQTTELAKSCRPFAAKDVSVEKLSPGNNLGRHCSFNAIDRTPSSQIKRSKSHISLLSGNFAKFNRFGKLDVKLEDVDDDSDTSTKADLWKQNKLRSQSLPSTNSSLIRMGDDRSEMSIRDIDKDEEEVLEQSNRIRFSREPEEKYDIRQHDKSDSQLQSLQILKNILPQIDKTQFQNGQSASSLEPYENVCGGREHRSIESKIKSFNEQMPSVNLQSWNERPRRQISIKTDRDYVFGGLAQSSVTCNKVGDHSRVPVVTAVAFKKPFTPPSCVTVNENDHSKRKVSTIVVVSEQKPSVVFSNQDCGLSSSASRLWSADTNSTASSDSAKTGRISSFTFKEYKNKLASKEKSSKKDFDGSSNTCSTTAIINVNRSTYNYDGDVKVNHSDKTSIHCNDNYRNCTQTTDSSVNRQMNRGSSFVPVPPVPPPFLKPTLKPVNRDFGAKRPCSAANLDPRDVLLSSIKNFDRDRLRKLRVK